MSDRPPKPRLEHIDIAKGIGILLVVFGHLPQLSTTGFVRAVVYSFHMPLFFFLSGLFLNPAHGYGLEARKRFEGLLVPCFAAGLLWLVASLAIDTLAAGALPALGGPAHIAVGEYLFSVATGVALMGSGHTWPCDIWPFNQLWFLYSLFATGLFCLWIARTQLGPARPARRKVLTFSVLLAGAWASCRISTGLDLLTAIRIHDHDGIGLPFRIDLLLATSFFFLAGYGLRDTVRDLPRIAGRPWFAPAIAGGTAALLALVRLLPDRMEFFIARWDGLAVSTLEALLGIALVVAAAAFLDGRAPARPLAHLGRNSLWILVFHDFFLDSTTSVLALLGWSVPVHGHDLLVAVVFLVAAFAPLALARPGAYLLQALPTRLLRRWWPATGP